MSPAPPALTTAPALDPDRPVGASRPGFGARMLAMAPIAVGLFALAHLALAWTAFRSAARFDRTVFMSPGARNVMVVVVLGLLIAHGRSLLFAKGSKVVQVQRASFLALFAFVAFHLIARPLGPALAGASSGDGLYDQFAMHLSSLALGVPCRAFAYVGGVGALATYVAAAIVALPARLSANPRTLTAALAFVLLVTLGAYPVVFFATGGRFFGPHAEVEPISSLRVPKAPPGPGGAPSPQSPCTRPDSK